MKKKSLEELQELINTYICRDDVDNLLDTLSQSSSLNVDNSKYFNIAVESGNLAIVKALIDYFENNQLAKYEEGTLEFLVLKKKMHDILEVAVEDLNISEEMKKILHPYVNLIYSSEQDAQTEESTDKENLFNDNIKYILVRDGEIEDDVLKNKRIDSVDVLQSKASYLDQNNKKQKIQDISAKENFFPIPNSNIKENTNQEQDNIKTVSNVKYTDAKHTNMVMKIKPKHIGIEDYKQWLGAIRTKVDEKLEDNKLRNTLSKIEELKLKSYLLELDYITNDQKIKNTNLSLHEAMYCKYIEAIAPNDINNYNPSGQTLLMNSIHRGFLKATDLLLEKGADVNKVDIGGFSTLHYASLFPNIQISKKIIDKVQDINYQAKNYANYTAIHALICHGYKTVFSSEMKLLNNYQYIIGKLIIDPDEIDFSCVTGKREDGYSFNEEKIILLIKYMIEKGADINIANSQSLTPFFLACDFGFKFLIKEILDNNNFFKLAPNIKDNNGQGYLHWSLKLNDTDILEKILDARLDHINCIDNKGRSLMDLCEIINLPKINKWLIEKNYPELIEIGVSADEIMSIKLDKELLNNISTKEGCDLIEAVNEGDYDGDDIHRAFEDIVDILSSRGLDFFGNLTQYTEEIKEHSLQEILNNIENKESEDEFDDYRYQEVDEPGEAINKIKKDTLGDYDLEKYGSEVEYSGESDENYDYL